MRLATRVMFWGLLWALASASSVQAVQPNVLFICVDDLRPELGCQGEMGAQTPNLDRLASEGRLFTRHFVQFPTCGASRYSMLTSRRPSLPVHYTNAPFDELPESDRAGPASLPGAFRRAGYTTVGLGKISHSPDGRTPGGEPQLPGAWDEFTPIVGAWESAEAGFFGYAGGLTREIGVTPATEAADVADDGYPDGLMAGEACARLRRLAERADGAHPFFLAVGFYKPHLPFCAPKRYWDLYERDQIPPSPNPDPPAGLRGARVNPVYYRGELYPRYTGVGTDDGWTDDDRALLRHAYLACVSYTDAQIGRVLDTLDNTGLADDTIVVVWGDHGWHLGDHAVFGKHTTFERALASALIIRAPGMAEPGRPTDRLVESLDLFPTLASICGVATDALAGRDISALLREGPGADLGTPSEADCAVSYWRKGKFRADSIRTPTHRLVVWRDADGNSAATELYDHTTDPHETKNIAAEHPGLVRTILDAARR